MGTGRRTVSRPHVVGSTSSASRRTITPAAPRMVGGAALAAALLAYSALVVAAALGIVGTAFSSAGDSDTPEPAAQEAGAERPPTSGAPPSFVTRSSGSFFLDGTAFRFTGFNLYNAAATGSYSCPGAPRLDDSDLDAAMRQVHDAGGTLVRIWAFQSYTRSGTDYSGVDRVLDAARAHGLKVLPVLENQWRDCSRPGVGPLSEVQDGNWFDSGYRSPLPGQALSFRDYTHRITHHYRSDPTVFAWSLVNEAETTRTDDQGESELVGFARDMAALVHRSDPHHLLTLGTQSNGAPGSSGQDFSDVYGLAGLDFAEVHDWANRGSDDQAMPGAPSGSLLPHPNQCRATTAPLACSFSLAGEMNKPIIVAEAGIAAHDPLGRAVRAHQLDAKLEAAFQAGADGYLIWQLNQTNTDEYGVVIGSDDPLYSVLRNAREQWDPRVRETPGGR